VDYRPLYWSIISNLKKIKIIKKMKLINNIYSGKEENAPGSITGGGVYIASDTGKVFAYDSKGGDKVSGSSDSSNTLQLIGDVAAADLEDGANIVYANSLTEPFYLTIGSDIDTPIVEVMLGSGSSSWVLFEAGDGVALTPEYSYISLPSTNEEFRTAKLYNLGNGEWLIDGATPYTP
jgi:hypothetical protein